MKKVLTALSAAVILIGTVGCGASAFKQSTDYKANSYSPNNFAVAEESYDDGMADSDYELKSERNITDFDQKIAKTTRLSIEVSDYNLASDSLKSFVKDSGGYVEDVHSYVYRKTEKRDFKSGSFTLRVPVDHYDSVRNQIFTLGKITTDSENAQNLTNEYFDTEARLKAKEKEETRLLELILKAEKIDELILLEERLSNVRAEIERHQSRINTIDRTTAYSTIYVELTEAFSAEIEPVSENFGSKIKNVFINSINGVKTFFEYCAIFIAGAIVPLLILAAVFVVVIVIVKKSRKP